MAEKDAQVSEPAPAEQTDLAPPQAPLPVHSIFPRWQRIIYVYIASLAAFASPVSSSIYYPAMSSLAHDLNTSLTNISFTITAYMVRMLCVHNISYTSLMSARSFKGSHRRSWAASRTESAADRPTSFPSPYSWALTLASPYNRTMPHF